MEIKKGNKSFVEFLNKELTNLGLRRVRYWEPGYIHPDSHFIYKDIPETSWWKKIFDSEYRSVRVAEIIGEPDSPLYKGSSDAFRIRLLDKTYESEIKTLAEKFEKEDFGIPVEIIY